MGQDFHFLPWPILCRPEGHCSLGDLSALRPFDFNLLDGDAEENENKDNKKPKEINEENHMADINIEMDDTIFNLGLMDSNKCNNESIKNPSISNFDKNKK